MVKLVADTFENHNASHEATRERIRALEAAMRKLAWDHGFRQTRSLISGDYQEWDIRVEVEYRLDFGLKPMEANDA